MQYIHEIAAATLGEDTAKAWEILVTESVRAAARDSAALRFEPLEVASPGADKAHRTVTEL